MVLVALLAASSWPLAGQGTSTLRLRVTLQTAAGQTVPVARHALLVSDNPASMAPRRVITGADGTASVPLRPGNYTVESDQPLVFEGRRVQWTVTLDVAAGGDTVVELSAANAESLDAPGGGAPAGARALDPSDVAGLWRPSLATLWLPTTRALGFVADGAGLVATSRQVVGDAPTVEVQFSPTVKREGRVVVADAASDVAVIAVDPAVTRGLSAVPLACDVSVPPALRNGQPLQAFDWFPGDRVRLTDGKVQRVASRQMVIDFSLDLAAVGGPAFTMEGAAVGLTSLVGEKEGDRRYESRIVRADAVCDALAAARQALASGPAPSAVPLPVEPPAVIPAGELERIAKGRAGATGPYRMSTPGFDVALLTPLQVYAAPASMSFGNWADYVNERPSVLLVRATPKQAEPFWGTLVRGLAMSQGMMLPAIRRFKPGVARIRALCGATEVTPIHPFKIERRVSNTDAVYEGLYVFAPDALTAECGTVTFEVFSEKAPGTAETVAVDPEVLGRIWQDFAPYRALVRQ